MEQRGGNAATVSVSDPPASAAHLEKLHTFYQHALANRETQRREFLERVSAADLTSDIAHQISWELSDLQQRASVLRDKLDISTQTLTEVRGQVVDLAQRCAELRMQETEDRKTIQHLLALTHPITQEVTFFQDSRPDTVTKYPVGSGPGGSMGVGGAPHAGPRRADDVQIEAYRGVDWLSTASSSGARGGSGGDPLLRTVYLPTERETELLANLEELHIRLQALSAPTEEHHEQARLWQRRVAEVKETEAEVFARESALEEEEKRLAVSIDKLRRVTKDLLYLQYTAQVQKRLRYEEEAQLASTSEWAVGQLQRLRNTSLKASHMKRIRAEATKRFRETHGGEGSDGHGEAGAGRGAVAVADRVQTHAAESRMLQERMAVARQLYERRIDELRSQLDAARKKMRTITRRRKLEHEGFAHDVEQLQKELFEVVEFGDLDGALGA
jgi:coiled-coil domain-containing protein 77